MITPPHARYYLALNLVPGLGAVRQKRLIECCDSAEKAWLQAGMTECMAAGLDKKTTAALFKAREMLDLEMELERVANVGATLVTIEDNEYPKLLGQIAHPPPLLYVRGTFRNTDDWSVAVVGTRSPTTYGKEATRHLVKGMAQNGLTVVSGLAIGIDSVAHTTALEEGGRTIGVLGCGVDHIYPERNRWLVDEMLGREQGVIISEYPLGTRPHSSNFPPRNRIISGLSLATLVAEAGESSGSLITVEFALDQGRDVLAIPGSIFNRTSIGTHNLIRNGAALVRSVDDVLESLNLNALSVQQEFAAALPEDPTEAALMEHLSAEPQHIDLLCRTSGMPAATVSSTLAMLELKGYARHVGNMEYVRR
jgi:DNA processing protein